MDNVIKYLAVCCKLLVCDIVLRIPTFGYVSNPILYTATAETTASYELIVSSVDYSIPRSACSCNIFNFPMSGIQGMILAASTARHAAM